MGPSFAGFRGDTAIKRIQGIPDERIVAVMKSDDPGMRQNPTPTHATRRSDAPLPINSC